MKTAYLSNRNSRKNQKKEEGSIKEVLAELEDMRAPGTVDGKRTLA